MLKGEFYHENSVFKGLFVALVSHIAKRQAPIRSLPFVTNWLLVSYFYYWASVLRALQKYCLTPPVLVNVKRFLLLLFIVVIISFFLLFFIVFIILIYIAFGMPAFKSSY